jgi:uncharacterized membrane protein
MRMAISKVNRASILRVLLRLMTIGHTAAYILTPIVAILILFNEHVSAQSFFPIDVREPSTRFAVPFDVSSDGSRIGGAILYYNVDIDCGGIHCTTPFTWSATGGIDIESYANQIQLFQTPYGLRWQYAEEIVAVAGNFALANGSSAEPTLFTAGGHRLLRTLPTEAPALIAKAMSDDGSVIVGWDGYSQINSKRAFRWTDATGVQPIAFNDPFSYATGVSGDGRVIIGTTATTWDGFGEKAFRWSETEGTTYLGSITASGRNVPAAVSYDGAFIVGTAFGHSGTQAYRWSAIAGIVPLNIPNGFSASVAADVTADGTKIVGQLIGDSSGVGFSGWSEPTTDFGFQDPDYNAATRHAMIWDSANGTRVLKDVLVNEFGLDDQLAGWSLLSASSISADGKVIGGVGVNPDGNFQGWVVSLVPEPNSIVMAVGCLAILLCRRRIGFNNVAARDAPTLE